jgi:glycopeptide antibiotics resistance protein
MSDEFKQYIISLYQDIPQEVYEGLLSVFCIGLVVFIAWKGFKTGFRYSAILLLVEYIFLIFCSTVIFRATGETRQYDFHPFWSYKAIQDGREDLLAENIMNVVVFVPVGLMLGSFLRVKGSSTSEATKSMTWLMVAIIGCGISVTIESLQFFFMRGFSEVDDVMHNTVGCILGYIMVKGSRFVVKSSGLINRITINTI